MSPILPVQTRARISADDVLGDRLVFPAAAFRKSDVLKYYEGVAGYLLPHLRDRPVTLKRYPDDAAGQFFYEKDAPAYTPAWVKKFGVWRRSGESILSCLAFRTSRRPPRWCSTLIPERPQASWSALASLCCCMTSCSIFACNASPKSPVRRAFSSMFL